jgi:hypothetical protein
MSATDDLRNQIKFRGLKQGGFQDPVKEFKGKLEGFDIVESVFNNQPTGRSNVVLKFSELDVIVSTEPWQFPVKEVSIGYSDRQGSRWGIFAESGVKFLRDDEEFQSLIGRRLHLKIVVHKLYQGKEKGEQPADCWEIVGVERATGSSNGKAPAMSSKSQLLLLLNGHTEQQFNMEALKLPAVKGDSALTTNILNKSFVMALISNGLVVKDDAGVFTLTDAGVASLQG